MNDISAPRSGRHVPRVYFETPLADGSAAVICGVKHHHLRNVLRLAVGDAVIAFDGAGGELPARIEAVTRDRTTVILSERSYPAREPTLRITLAQAVIGGARMDQALARAVELGVCALQPVTTARSRLHQAAAHNKREHWQRVAVAAAEQSGRERVPEVRAPKALADLLEGLPHGLRLVLQPDAAATPGALAPTDQVLLLTGPESGWTAQELEQIQSHGFTALRMGPRVLRAETAGPACLAVLQALWGDFR